MLTAAVFVFKFGWFGAALIVAVYLLAAAEYLSGSQRCDNVFQENQMTHTMTSKAYCLDRSSSLPRKPLDDCPCPRSR